MTDITAISLMQARNKCHRDFKIPNNSTEFDTFQDKIAKATKVTSDAIQQVNNYVRRIQEEMLDLRSVVEVFNADLAEQMKTLLSKIIASNPTRQIVPPNGSSGFDVNPAQRDTSRNTGRNTTGSRASDNASSSEEVTVYGTDMENLQQLTALQKISYQQQELRKMMVEVDSIMKEFDRNGEVSVEDIIALKQNVDQWALSLESADVEYARKKEEERKEMERKRKQEEEMKRQKAEEEEKKRKQEEKERKQKASEEEKRRKEDEMKRKEMEAKKKEEEAKKQKEIQAKKRENEERQRKEREEAERLRNWRNWPPMIFCRHGDITAYHKGVICVALAMEGELVKDDLTCYASDGNNDRERCLQAEKKEVPVSSLVTIKPSTKSAIRLKEPLHVFIPHQVNQSARDIVVKASVDGAPWKTIDYETDIPPNVNVTDIHMVHIVVNNFKSVGIIVASRPKFHAFSIGKEGGTVETKKPLKARLRVPKDCFSEKTNGTLQITDKKHTVTMAKDIKDLRNTQLALAPHNITFEKKSKSDISLEIYPDLQRIIPRPQSALKTCEKTMIKEMDAETVADILYEKGIISSTTLTEIKYKKSKEEKVKALVEDLLFCEESEFQQLIESLEESNQQNLASILRKAFHNISSKEMGSDFVEENDDKVAILACKNNQGWTVVDFEKVKDNPDACLLTLPPEGKSFSVVGLIVPKSFKETELSRLAELFYVSSEQFRMRLIVKQHIENKHHLAIRCVNPELFSTSVSELKSQGFTEGPSESVEFSVSEGETVWLQLMGNRKFASQQSSEVHFKVYMSAIYTMDIRVSEAKGKDNSSRYKNDLQYNVGLIEQKPPRHGVFKLQI